MAKKKKRAKIVCTYVKRGTGCPAGSQTFIGKDLIEANILAANFQSSHLDLIESSCDVKNPYYI